MKMRYIGEGDVVLLRHNGDQVLLKTGDEIDLTEAEVAGCACKPERADGIWERVEQRPSTGTFTAPSEARFIEE